MKNLTFDTRIYTKIKQKYYSIDIWFFVLMGGQAWLEVEHLFINYLMTFKKKFSNPFSELQKPWKNSLILFQVLHPSHSYKSRYSVFPQLKTLHPALEDFSNFLRWRWKLHQILFNLYIALLDDDVYNMYPFYSIHTFHNWRILLSHQNFQYEFKWTVCQFLSFNMLICAKIGASVQNLCPVRHFNPKLWALEVGQGVPLLSRPKLIQQNSTLYQISKHFKKLRHLKLCNAA